MQMQRTLPASVTGSPFNDALAYLHEHAFTGVPGESDPFTLPLLDREFIAYALSCYYQCDHCQEHHEKAVSRLLAKEPAAWSWHHEVVKTVLFLRAQKSEISPVEWQHWLIEWERFANVMQARRPGLVEAIAYAIGFARDDKDLLDFSWERMAEKFAANQLKGVVRDIVRVAIFMKAATSKNRVEPVIMAQFSASGLDGAA